MTETTTVEVGGTTASDSVTAAVVEGIATIADCDPVELDVCLADYLDTDALEALFDETATTDGAVELAITIDRYDVTVDSSGYVTVSRLTVAEEPSGAAVGI